MASALQIRQFKGVHWFTSVLQAQNSGAWLRFLLAAAGLTLAFGAAIFSTAARDAGNVVATVVLATLALLLAAAVGLGVVPYLARRVGARRLREALDFEVTRAGVLYAVVVLLIGVAALNTGNNLLYIIVAAMLAAIAVSGFASSICLYKLELDLKIPDHIFAGTEIPATVSVRNPRTWVPSLSVSAVPIEKDKQRNRWRWVATTFPIPPWRPPERQWLQLPDRKLRRITLGEPSGVFHQSAYFPLIPPKAQLQADVKLTFRRRGRYQERFSLSTRFPFAFLVKTRRVALARDVLVYPELTNSEDVVELLPVLSGKLEAYLRGRGADLYRIREYLPEDSARHVDWKATAKSGSLKVREFSREDDRKLRIVFDNPSPGVVPEPAYENAVRLAASLAWHFARENATLSFAAPDYDGVNDIHAFLSYLALVEPAASASLIEAIDISDEYNIILTSRPRASIPAVLWACSYLVFMEGHP